MTAKKKNSTNTSVKILQLGSIKPPRLNGLSSNKKWVKYGEDNMYPNQLINYTLKNSLHSSILNKKVDMICSNGFTFENETDIDKAEELIFNDTLKSIVKKIAIDLEIFNGFSLNVLPTKGSKQMMLEHINFSNLRSGVPNEDGIVEEYFYSNDWKSYNNKPESFPAYDEKNSKESQIIYNFQYNLSSEVYPIAYYQPLCSDIDSYIKISSFNNSILRNGMTPSLFLNVIGDYTDDEKQQILQDLESQYQGEEAAGKFIVSIAPNQESISTVTTVELNGAADYYKNLEELLRRNIIQGHQIPEALIQNIQGTLGNRNQIVEESRMFYENYIEKKQSIIEDQLNSFFSQYGISEFKFNKPKFTFSLSEETLKIILTVDELRELAGFEKKEIIIKEGGQI